MSRLGNNTRSPSDLLLRPLVTEKASRAAEARNYVFVVAPGATKRSIMQALRTLYKVQPLSVRVVNVPAKKRANRGLRSGFRKVYVTLKEGESITLA